MQTLTEIVAAVVVHSSAVAYSHFGVTIEPHQPERPAAAERKVARSARVIPATAPQGGLAAAADAPCPETRAPRPAGATAKV
ncbi:MAG: hypothetical protein ACK4TR_09400 [Phenylobacterium sp.]|uniref:hypothetical protein n=1 Tax=Phenylobacterium sp. TaxID=1871053 RepID=UPI00391D3785